MRLPVIVAVVLLAAAPLAPCAANTAGPLAPIAARQLSENELHALGWGRVGSPLIFDYGFMLSSDRGALGPFTDFSGPLTLFRTRSGQLVKYDIEWGAGGHAIALTNFRPAPPSAQSDLARIQEAQRGPRAADVPILAGYRFVSGSPNGSNWVGVWRSVSNPSLSRLVAFSPRTRASEVLWEGPVKLSSVSALPGLHGEGSTIDLAGVSQDGNVIIARLEVAGCSEGPSGTHSGPLLWERRPPGEPPLSSCEPAEPARATSAPAGSPASRSRR